MSQFFFNLIFGKRVLFELTLSLESSSMGNNFKFKRYGDQSFVVFVATLRWHSVLHVKQIQALLSTEPTNWVVQSSCSRVKVNENQKSQVVVKFILRGIHLLDSRTLTFEVRQKVMGSNPGGVIVFSCKIRVKPSCLHYATWNFCIRDTCVQ